MKLLSILFVVLSSVPAFASPHPNPMSYPYATLNEGALEFEQYVDLVPVRVARENPDGTLDGVIGVRSVLQTEIEYGITDTERAAINSWVFIYGSVVRPHTSAASGSYVWGRRRKF